MIKSILIALALVLVCGCLPDDPVVAVNEEIAFEEPVILEEESATVEQINISSIGFSYGPHLVGGVYVNRGKIIVFLTGVGLLDMEEYVANHGGNFSDTVVAEIYDNGIRFNNKFITAFGSSIYQTKITLMVDTVSYIAFMNDFEAWNAQNGLFQLHSSGESTLPGGRVYQQKSYERVQ